MGSLDCWEPSDRVNPIGLLSLVRDDLFVQFELEGKGEDNDEVISPVAGETLLLDGQSIEWDLWTVENLLT